MKKYVKFGVLALLGITLVSGVNSCKNDDPDYGDVTPPAVAPVYNISGSVAGMDGNGISGATVTLSGTAKATATTDGKGYFIFENVATGTYDLTATATGKLSMETSVSVTEDTNGQNVFWNVMLASEKSVANVEVSAESGGEGDVMTEALEGNEKAEIPIDIVIAKNSLNKDAVIEMSPVYTEAGAVRNRAVFNAETRAASQTLVSGVRMNCPDNTVRIEQPIDLTFNVDETTTTEVKAQKYSNGAWVDVPSRIENGKIIISADEFTSYGLFTGINFTTTSRTEKINFSQSTWDNLYGNKNMSVGTATYTCKVGMDMNTSGTTVFTALLIEALVRRFGIKSYEVQGSYPINVTLPIGTSLQVNGIQQINTVTAAVGKRSVSGTQYGDVTISVVTANRQHTGGSN